MYIITHNQVSERIERFVFADYDNAAKHWHEYNAELNILTHGNPVANQEIVQDGNIVSFLVSDNFITEEQFKSLCSVFGRSLLNSTDGGLGDVFDCDDEAVRVVNEWIEANNIDII
jgi:hypothetical protein